MYNSLHQNFQGELIKNENVLDGWFCYGLKNPMHLFLP